MDSHSFDFSSLLAEAFAEEPLLSPTYPSDWFMNNPGSKPSVELPVMDCSLDQVRSTVKHFLLKNPSHRLDPDLVLLYFRKLADTTKGRLEEDWTSFGITIGKAGTEVGPLDIVDVKDRAAVKLKLEPSVAAAPEDDLWICMALAAIYHRSAAAAGNWENSKASCEVLDQWETAGFKTSLLGRFWKANSMLSNLSACPSYPKMIAVFDMFLFKFSDHGLSAVRNLTRASRFQGFAAYQSLFRLSKSINKNFREIRKWMFTAPLQKEYQSITTSGQELDQPHSYTPYFMDLQLSSVSPYSEDANPCLHLFTNIVGASMNDRDARCARMPEKIVPSYVTVNAVVFAYSLSYRGERVIGVPAGNDAEGWSRWFSTNNYGSFVRGNPRPPTGMIQKLSRVWSTFGQDRPGTIGKMLYELKP